MADKNDTELQRGEEGGHQQEGMIGDQGKPSSTTKGRTGLWMVYVAHALSTWGDNL